jgi:hypothetical protein
MPLREFVANATSKSVAGTRMDLFAAEYFERKYFLRQRTGRCQPFDLRNHLGAETLDRFEG